VALGSALMEEGKAGYKVAADGHVYHKSATANATTAPTNEATKENAAKTKGLTPEAVEFVTVLDYEWHLKGNLDPAGIRNEYGYSEDEFNRLAQDSSVHEALAERGISVKAIAPDSETVKALGRSKLTPIQLIVANSMLDLIDARPPKKKLADLNVSPYQYQSWMKDPEFRNYMHERSEGLLTDVSHEVMLSLIDKAMSGDMKAVAYYHEMTGRFISQTGSSQGQGSQHDLQSMIVRIVEIIVEEVEDPNTAARISERLKGLVMGHQLASAAVEVPVVPEIAPAREMTPLTKQMMERGVGVNE
jgi:hypothetical protein